MPAADRPDGVLFVPVAMLRCLACGALIPADEAADHVADHDAVETKGD